MLLSLIDRLAGWWLDWRLTHEISKQPDLAKTGFRTIKATPGGWEGTFITPASAMIATEMAKMLDKAQAKNFIQFDMIPRLDQGLRPVRVTVQWADGKSPAQRVAELEAELHAQARAQEANKN